MSNIGYLHAGEVQIDEARASYAQALRLCRESGDRVCEGIVYENQAELAVASGDIDGAYPAIERALSIADERDAMLQASRSLRHAGACRAILPAQPNTLQHALALSGSSEDAMARRRAPV